MKSKIFVTFVNQYEVEGVTGTTCHYFFVDDDGAITGENNTGKGPAGQQCAKVSMPYEARQDFPVVPGYYDGEFIMTTGSDRKPVLKLIAASNGQPAQMGARKQGK